MEHSDKAAVVHWLSMGPARRNTLLEKHKLALYYGIMPWSDLPEMIKAIVRLDMKEPRNPRD